MIIGADGGALAVTDDRLRVGVYKVSLRLLENLTHKYNSNNYRIYSHQGIGESVLQWGTRVENRVSPIPKGYMHVWMPIELFKNPVDVFLGLSQILPGLSMTTHIITCRDVWQDVAKVAAVLRRFGNHRKKSGFISRSESKAAPNRISSSRRFPPKYIGFIYDLAFLWYPDAFPDSHVRLTNQTADLALRADHIITISEATKEDIVGSYRVPKEKITVAYPGIDRVFSANGDRHRHARPYFLSVGALKRQKNIPFLLRAFRQYLDSGAERTDLVLIGGNFWPDPEIRKTIASLRLEGAVKVMGTVPDAELPSYYRGALAFVSPSLREGFGLPVAEAMASGCPVIVTDSGSYPEIVGDAGIVVDRDSSTAMSQAMSRVSRDRVLAASLKTKGIKRAKTFRWETFAGTVMDAINSSVKET